ncbi:MAG TPA: GAF domain-containing protein [Pyrinomonadaceae bacterium]|jgi:GAF domain-containing protein|nr:GAF domain-containing protein [Pyrinomonadaceae bacterium]
MAEELFFTKGADRETIYEEIIPQIRAVIEGERDLIANLANTAAILKEAFGFFWVGFYIRRGEELVLGPFQGPLACTRIALGKGVCGTSYVRGETIIVEDVNTFPGHIACSSLARSEIVVPIKGKGVAPLGVLDVDSDKLADFSQADANGLEAITDLIAGVWVE